MIRRLLTDILLLFALLVTAPALALADEVRLRNGDRYTGTIVSLARGTLTFGTPNGTLTIPWTEVTGLTSDQALLITVGGNPPASQAAGVVTLTDVTAIALPEPALVIDGGANAGLIGTGGNTDINSIRIDGNLVARAGANRYTVTAAVNRAEDRGAETSENWNAGANYDRFLTPRLFLNANSLFTHDRFRDIDLRTALGAAVGYQVVDTARVRFAAKGGIGYVDENLDAAVSDAYTAARESVTLDVFVGGGRAQLFHQHDGYFGVTGDDNRFVTTKNGIRVGLTSGLVTTLQIDVDYDRSPAPGRQNTDRTFALTLGYRF